MKRVTVLGSTGTIGVNTLDVLAQHSDKFQVFALSANGNYLRLVEQSERFKPTYIVLNDETHFESCRRLLQANGLDSELLCGEAALEQVASSPLTDIVMAAIVGAAGLKPTLAAARSGKRVLLANKEALVMSGNLLMDAVRECGAELLPIDSEHNAIFQAMPSDRQLGLARGGVTRIVLTASGGPFRAMDPMDLKHVTPAQAVKHPNWVMGKKISVDSATMMNKGLEVIEACWLFDAKPEQVEILIHPESIVHSMVGYRDGSVLAQMSNPDMRTPIAFGLGYPDRIEAGVAELDLAKIGALHFESLDRARFPCVELAYRAIEFGGTATAVLNAANEVAVESFLNEELPFSAIYDVIDFALGEISPRPVQRLADVLSADCEARIAARDWVRSRANRVGKIQLGVTT
ncbi:MAG: 1-deoxy-D-xylulose-5-phosphate reductoisomerase [Pseudomonadota bacterium]|nr:1-deoxy-D-xylulose-5-phosphate reductoisomerase [Pseudomonadota bacterium]